MRFLSTTREMLVSFLSTHFPTEIRGASDGAAAEKKLLGLGR